MSDKEIIKSLECCAGDGYTCDDCEYFKLDFSDTHYCCDYFLKQDALGLIKGQQAEIEMLQNDLSIWSKNPIGFSTVHFPLPSRFNVSSI